MADLKLGLTRAPKETQHLFSQQESISADDLSLLVRAALAHLHGDYQQASDVYHQVAGQSPCSQAAVCFSGCIQLLSVVCRRLLPWQRRPAAIKELLAALRTPPVWLETLSTAVEKCPQTAGTCSGTPKILSVAWDLDVVAAGSAGTQLMQPLVTLRLNCADNSAICLRFSKPELLRFRRQMAMALSEMKPRHVQY